MTRAARRWRRGDRAWPETRLRVIAEGVETDEQLAFLRDNNCDEMQGYLFSRPVPPAEIENLIKRRPVWGARLGAGAD